CQAAYIKLHSCCGSQPRHYPPQRRAALPNTLGPDSRDLARGEAVFARAKLAGNSHTAIRFAHFRELRGSKLAQVNLDALARAATRRGKPGRARDDHALLMEQPVEQTLR